MFSEFAKKDGERERHRERDVEPTGSQKIYLYTKFGIDPI